MVPFWLFNSHTDFLTPGDLIEFKVKDWIFILIVTLIFCTPAFTVIRQSTLANRYFDWSLEAMNYDVYDSVRYKDYVTLKRIFFLENWKLPEITPEESPN